MQKKDYRFKVGSVSVDLKRTLVKFRRFEDRELLRCKCSNLNENVCENKRDTYRQALKQYNCNRSKNNFPKNCLF